MKLRIFTFVIILMLIGLPIGGCGNSANQDITEIQPVNQDIIEVMKILPSYTRVFWSIDLKQMRENANLNGLYQFLISKEFFDEEGLRSSTGIRLSDVNTLILTEKAGTRNHWALFKGDLNFEEIRQVFSRMFLQLDYGGVEIWRSSSTSFGFFEDMGIMCDTYEEIDVAVDCSKGEGRLMYDDEYFRTIIDKLPPGIGYSLIKNEYMGGQVGGITIYESDNKILIRGWYKFPSGNDASSYISDIEQNLEAAFSGTDIECYQHDDFVEINGEMSIEDLITSDYWKYYGFSH